MAAALVAFVAGCDDGDSGDNVRRDGDTIVVLTPADMAPYSYYDEAAKEFKGIEIDFVRTAAKKLGRKVEVRRCPFDELLVRVKAGVVSLSATLHVILDEICSNIVKHSDASFFELGLSRLVGSSGVRMEFVDDGVPYDPLTHVDPDTTAPVEGRPIGGLGILMVKRMASSVTYQRVADRNCLVIERTCKTQGDCSGSKG